MAKKVRIISIFLILICFGIIVFFEVSKKHNIIVQNRIIDDIFGIDVVSDSLTNTTYISDGNNFNYNNSSVSDYLGYIYIPRFNIRRLIKNGTDSVILNQGFVGQHRLSGELGGDDLIILAGHNVSNVFSKLHSISVGDVVYIYTFNVRKEFVVYDSKIVSEYDYSYLNNRKNELLLITCTRKNGERLLVFLKEVL